MKDTSNKYRIFLPLFWVSPILAGLFSCNPEIKESQWDIGALVPIGSTSLSIEAIVPDSLAGNSDDSLITLVFEQELYEVEPIELLNMPDTQYQFRAYLDSIKISPIELEQQVTLGDILTESGFAIFIPNGSNMALPPITGITSSNIQINASQYFTSMTLSQGFLDITIKNQLPVDITNLIFEVLNADDLSLISRDTFALIPKSSQALKTISLVGKTIRGQMIANIINMNSPGSGGTPVLINYTDAVIARLKVYNLKPFEATAIFPAQDLVNKGDKVYFNIGEIALDYIECVKGFLTIQSYNTIEDPVHFMYKIPGLTMNGDTFVVSGTIAAAQNGQATVVNQVHDVSGYNLDLRGAGPFEQAAGMDLNANGHIDADTINTAFILARASIDSTGNLIHLSLQDSFIFKSSLTELIPLYAKGFLGRDTLPISGSATIELPEILRTANVELEETTLRIGVTNQFGFSNQLAINKVEASNSHSGLSSSLNVAQLPRLSMIKPVNPFNSTMEVIPTYSEYLLDQTNSNITDLTEIFPDRIDYDFTLFVNAGVTPPPIGQGTDFIYNSSRLKASLNMEVPLHLLASDLILKDTILFSADKIDFGAVQSGKLFFIVDNEYPLAANLGLSLLDSSSGESIALGLSPSIIQGISGSETSVKTILELSLDDQTLEHFRQSEGIILSATFGTTGSAPVKIYQSKSIQITITGDFVYTVNK